MYFPFLKYPILLFTWVGVNPQKGYNKQQIFLFSIILFAQWHVMYLVILYMVYKEDDITMSDITTALESLFIIFHGVVKLVILFVKRRKVNDLLERMNNHFWKIENVKDIADKKEHLKYLTFIKVVFILYNCLSVTTTISFTCRTFFIEGDYLTFTTYKPDWVPFYLMLFYQGLVFVLGIFCPVPGLDLLMLALMLLTKMQFKLLNQEIRRLFKDIDNPGENVENFNMKMKKIVDYHNFLLDFVNTINSVFSEGMLVYVLTILLSMCVEMYIVSTQKTLQASIKAVLYILNGLGQYIVCYCLPGQAITDEAERTTEYLYFNKWYEYPTSSVKVAYILMIGRAQKKALILAGGFVKVDLETCLKTIRTMVSYAMFIRTMGLSEKSESRNNAIN